MAKRKHPGVTLIKPEPARERVDSKTGKVKRSGAMGWRVRYVDPDTGRTVKRALDRTLTTKADRVDYAVRLSERLGRRRLDLEGGASKATGTPFADAIQRYYDAHPKLRPKTVTAYMGGTDKLLRFARRHRIRTVDDLDRRKLMMFREQIVNEPKRYSAARGKRGAKHTNGDPRSAYSVNRELSAVSTTLRYLIDCDLFARLTTDDVRRCCKPLKATADRKKFLRPAQTKKLLAAALRHDADTFKATRTEHRGEAPAGTTAKYPAIAPFVTYILLTGCRLGEALRQQWENIELDDGNIHVGTESKTSLPRDIDIAPSPALGRLLAAQRLRTGGKGSVWGLTEGEAGAAMDRLRDEFGAPKSFSYQILRVTCQSYLASAPSIYGAASIFLAARRGGHSVSVCEKHYAGAVKNISPDARTIESAMQIEAEAAEITKTIGQVSKKRAAVTA